MDFSEWRDADFYSLASQATIHSLASLKTEKNTSKFLVSCMNCQFCSVEYQIGEKITPVMKAVQFSHLPMPGDAEVVAISVFERLPPKQGHVVGITYVIFNKAATTSEQQESTVKSQAFNVYSAIMDGEDGGSSAEQVKLEVIAENCQSVPLIYIPYCLKNTVVQLQTGTSEPVFLISGSDNRIHLYKEELGEQPAIVEIESRVLFPEFQNLHSIAETMDIARPDSLHRVTAIGFQDGPVEVYQVNTQTLEIVNVWKSSTDGPITSLHFFTQRKLVPVPPCFENQADDNSQEGKREEVENPDFTHLHLLMTVHLEPALVYRNVLNSGLSEVLTLPDSDHYDSALCSVAMDVDFDGEHEVIIGTYGQELLIYKFFQTLEKEISLTSSATQSHREESTSPPSSASRRLTLCGSLSPTDGACKHRHRSEKGSALEKTLPNQHRKVKSQEDLMGMLTSEKGREGRERGRVMKTVLEPHYRLQWRRAFPCPIMALGSGDMMGDGLENLVVLTSFGIHILQPNTNKVMDLLLERLSQCVTAHSLADEFHKLQLE